MANYLDADGLNIYHNGATINEKKLPATLYAQDIPSKNLFDTVKAGLVTRNTHGVTCSLASDGTGIVLNGTSDSTVNIWARSTNDATLWLPQGEYRISYEVSGTGSSGVLSFGVQTSDGQTYQNIFTAPSSGITIVNFFIGVTNNVQYNCTLYPMIRSSTVTDSMYVPHAKTNVELTQAMLDEEWITLYSPGASTQCTLVAFTATPVFVWFTLYGNRARTKYRLLCRVKFDNVVRQSGGIAFKIITTHYPPKNMLGYGGLRSTGGNTGQSAYWGVDTAYWEYSTDGVITVHITETYTNIANGNSFYVLIPATESVPLK